MNVELFLDYITCMVFLVYFNDRNEHFSEWNTAPYETNLLTTYSILCLIIILFILAYWSIRNYIFSNFISLILYKIKILLYGINLIFNKTLEFWWFFWISSKAYHKMNNFSDQDMLRHNQSYWFWFKLLSVQKSWCMIVQIMNELSLCTNLSSFNLNWPKFIQIIIWIDPNTNLSLWSQKWTFIAYYRCIELCKNCLMSFKNHLKNSQ